LNFSGLESEHTGFKITLPMVLKMFYCVEIADLLMSLRNQSIPYELEKVSTFALEEEWVAKSSEVLSKKNVKHKDVKRLYTSIIKDFERLKKDKSKKAVKVGIVGEIFVKFSPLGNNELEKFLYSEGVEVSMSGLLDFCLYCIYDNVLDYKLYKKNKKTAFIFNLVYRYILRLQKQHIALINKYGSFTAPTYFEEVVKLSKGYVGYGMKMGEGWLLTSEMLELIDKGVNNIICAQPFGCLPNHIVGKGMMKLIKENNLNTNLVAIDYDASASKVNQENRIKLMSSTARSNFDKNSIVNP
jgi:predicted nucleotide-binding protein (sugar kinase/HSP70/actin superfamily)